MRNIHCLLFGHVTETRYGFDLSDRHCARCGKLVWHLDPTKCLIPPSVDRAVMKAVIAYGEYERNLEKLGIKKSGV